MWSEIAVAALLLLAGAAGYAVWKAKHPRLPAEGPPRAEKTADEAGPNKKFKPRLNLEPFAGADRGDDLVGGEGG